MPKGSGYEVVLSSGAAAFLVEQPKAVQRRLIALLRTLSMQPAQPGDYSVRDSTGRWLQVLRVGKFTFTFWPDDAVGELRIIEISLL